MGFGLGDLLDPFDLVDTGGSFAPSNLLGFGDNFDDGLDEAARAQNASIDKQIDFLRESSLRAEERFQPFVDFGLGGIDSLQSMLSPEGQMDFLNNNPLFNAAIDNLQRQTVARNAAAGRSGGGVVDELFKNFLSTGDSFINSQFNRLLTPVNIGQASAAGQAANIQNTGTNVANAFGNQGDINAALSIQRQNMQNQQQQGLFNMIGGGILGSGIAGGAGLAGGGMMGAGLGALLFSDERLKDIEDYIGEDEDGNPIYKWKYKGDDVTHFGPMAQDVLETKPEAVHLHESGHLLLDMRAV